MEKNMRLTVSSTLIALTLFLSSSLLAQTPAEIEASRINMERQLAHVEQVIRSLKNTQEQMPSQFADSGLQYGLNRAIELKERLKNELEMIPTQEPIR